MDIDALKTSIKNISLNDIVKKAFQSSYIQKLVIQYNQQQLYEKGIDSTGTIIKTFLAHTPNVYADRTIIIKQGKGQRTDVVTLKDTGAFYESMQVTSKDKYIEITANFAKSDGNMNKNIDTTNILGLTDYNKEDLQGFLRPVVSSELKRAFLGT
jgi:hypothetical protein